MSAYDFNKRDEIEYSHSYDYLGGVGLGRAEVAAEETRKSKLGTYDKQPVDAPSSTAERDEVIKIAKLIHSSTSRASLIDKIRDAKDKRTAFVWDVNHPHHKYFEWALHCIDREVQGWEKIRPGGAASSSSATAKPAQPSIPPTAGDTVQVDNLRMRPELNGKLGKVVREENGRFFVEFPDIDPVVSISKANCTRQTGFTVKHHLTGERFPKGLRVEVANLTSETGKAINGQTGYIVDYVKESGRYTVRLEPAEFKNLKQENLLVCLPPDWERRIDESTGSCYYVHSLSGNITWKHPLFTICNKRSEPDSGFVKSDEHEEDDADPPTNDFSREQFLEEEKKRLKLDKKEKSKGMTKDKLLAKLDTLRSLCASVPPRDDSSVLYMGTPRVLLSTIDSVESEIEKSKYLFIGLAIMLEDYMSLKFNKTQLSELALRLDELIDNGAPLRFDPAITSWIETGLKIAIPTSYTIY